MKTDKRLIERALFLEGRFHPVEWSADFSTVEEMLRLGVGWRTIQTVLNEKYRKAFTVNGLVRSYNTFHLKKTDPKTKDQNDADKAFIPLTVLLCDQKSNE